MGREEHGPRAPNSADLAACKDTSKPRQGNRDAAAKFATSAAYSTAHAYACVKSLWQPLRGDAAPHSALRQALASLLQHTQDAASHAHRWPPPRAATST